MTQLEMFEGKQLEELRHKWRVTIGGDGGKCPCCDRWGKINNYNLNETMVVTLKWMTRVRPDYEDYIDMGAKAPRWAVRGKNYATMKFWGFVEPAPTIMKKPDNGIVTKSNGLWRVTNIGHLFVNGGVYVPSKAFVYDDTLMGWGDKMVTFRDCIGKKFNYDEIMSTNYNWSLK
jgi:hypothetical protein